MPIVCGGVVYALVTDAYDAFEHFGFFRFLTSADWNYTQGAEQYGALPFITGTLMTTLLALIFCIPFSLPVALFVGEYLRPVGFLHIAPYNYGVEHFTARFRYTHSLSGSCHYDCSIRGILEYRVHKDGTE